MAVPKETVKVVVPAAASKETQVKEYRGAYDLQDIIERAEDDLPNRIQLQTRLDEALIALATARATIEMYRAIARRVGVSSSGPRSAEAEAEWMKMWQEGK